MNLQELIKKSTVTKLAIEVNGNKGDIFVRPLMAGAKTELLKEVTVLLELKDKVDKAKKKNKQYHPTGEEIAQSSEYKMKQAYHLLCTSDGIAEYPSYREMVNNVPNEVMDAICEAIDNHLVPEDSGEIEKN
jgi:hypothetical protein